MEQKKYRILIVHNRYQIPGGEDTVVQNELNMLRKYGHEVFYYERNNNEMKECGVRQKLSLPFNTIYSNQSKKEIKELIQKNRIDLVHVHNTLLLISPSVYDAAAECKVPVVQTIHNFRFICPNGLFYRDGHVCEDCLKQGLNCAMKHGCYRHSKAQTLIVVEMLKRMRRKHVFDRMHCICLTEFNKSKFIESGLFTESQISVKPNYVPAVDHILPYSDRKNQIVFAGRLEEIKGIQFLLEVWKQFKEAPDLMICGDGPLEEECRKYTDLNQMSKVHLFGRVSHDTVISHMKESKATILASTVYEGFPMTIAESFSCGTPVIVPDFGNAGSLVQEDHNGFHYEPGSVSECIAAVQKLLNTSSFDIDELAALCSEEKNYTALMKIYDKAINQYESN